MKQLGRHRMQRRLFFSFGVAIFISLGVLFAVFQLAERVSPSPWKQEMERVTRFASNRFAEVWFDVGRRHDLAAAMASELGLTIKLVDARGATIENFGSCERAQYRLPVQRAGMPLGEVAICAAPRRYASAWRIALPLLLAGFVLWAASGKFARRLSRPLEEVARVARDIGDGKLASRALLRRHTPDEIGVVAEAINDMALKITKQMTEQRELLAAVSHELRTPLTRMRVLIELAREGDPKPHLDEIEREIAETDALVGELLASARLDFSAMRKSVLSAPDLAARALARAGEDETLLEHDGTLPSVAVDATLIARALANLIDNARKHGGGVRALRVRARPGRVAFELEDRGPGFSTEVAARLFQPFHAGGSETSSLGLGLSLVKRIAEAHGGSAYAENLASGGARVGFDVAV